MAALYQRFELLLANFVTLGRAVIAKDGFIIFEWPTYSRLWEEPSVREMTAEFHLTREVPWVCHRPLYEGRHLD